jgi:hypothetical protein
MVVATKVCTNVTVLLYLYEDIFEDKSTNVTVCCDILNLAREKRKMEQSTP